MTIRHYRLMVALRWSDLELLKVKDEPLKNHLQKLRKRKHRDEWCAVYDPPSGNESSANGSERFHRFTERKTSHIFGDDDDITIIVCRKASSSLKRAKGEFATVVSVEPVDSDVDIPEPLSEEEAPEVRGRSSLDSDRATSFGVRGSARLPRGYKRAVKNNEYIRNRVDGLRKTLKKLEGILLDPECDREKICHSISSIKGQISRLLSERSDVRSPPRGSRGGWEYAPPPNLDTHIQHRHCDVCNVCAHCRLDRGPYGSACWRCDEIAWTFRRDLRSSNVRTKKPDDGPLPGPYASERKIPRRSGGHTILFCGMCNTALSKAYCTNPCCPYWLRRQKDAARTFDPP